MPTITIEATCERAKPLWIVKMATYATIYLAVQLDLFDCVVRMVFCYEGVARNGPY